jgi:1,4-alpha-glucan branching enzyme
MDVPGKKLIFMGDEIGQTAEWNANGQIDWWLLDAGPYHRGVQRFVEDANKLYQREPALWEADYDHEGFFWVDCSDGESSVMSFIRQSRDSQEPRARGAEPHSRAARTLPHRTAHRRTLERSAEQRR